MTRLLLWEEEDGRSVRWLRAEVEPSSFLTVVADIRLRNDIVLSVADGRKLRTRSKASIVVCSSMKSSGMPLLTRLLLCTSPTSSWRGSSTMGCESIS